MNKKNILITGASSGFGFITSKTLALAGNSVFAGMRELQTKNAGKANELVAFAKEKNVAITPIDLDILDEISVQTAVDAILTMAGGIDVLINNAGMLCFGITEAFTAEQIALVFNTNVLGVIRMNRAVLPHFRERKAGLIVYVGSVTSNIISPFQGPYVASKSAEDKIAETTHYEVSRFGIDSVIVQPGAYTTGTNHFPGAMKPSDTNIVNAYTPIADLPGQLVAGLNRIVAEGGKANVQDVADKILEVVNTPTGKRTFRIIVDPQNHGAAPINEVAEKMQTEFLQRLGIEDLMKVRVS